MDKGLFPKSSCLPKIKRNMMVGDIVIVQGSNQIHGKWKLARVSKIFPSDDGRVRRVEIEYKNAKPDEEANKYSGTPFKKKCLPNVC